MFAIYLANYSLWETMYRSDCVLMTDNDCFERITKDWKSDFEKRQRVFGQRCFLDVVDDLMVYSLKETDVEARNDAILSYLTCQGRLLCCSAQSKRTMSLKLIEHLRNFTKDGKSFRGSFAISEEPIPPIGTALYLGVAPYDSEKDALEYVTRAYCRTLAVLRDQGLENVIKEVLVLFVHYQTPQVVCMLKKIEPKDYDLAPEEEIVSSDKYVEAKQRMNLSEWDVARQMP